MTATWGKLTAPGSVYQTRRARLAQILSQPLLLFAGRARARQMPSMTYPFRAGSHYLYFGGPPIEGAALLIEPGSDGCRGCTLIRPQRGFDDAVWVGPGPADGEIADVSGVSAASVLGEDRLEAVLDRRGAHFLAPPCPVTEAWAGRMKLTPPDQGVLSAIVDMRLTLDEHELAALRRAADAGVRAHKAAMSATKPGGTEASVAAAMAASLIGDGCDFSFSPIVTVRGEILHCETFPNRMEAGQLLLVDAGAEEPGGYASDITRTYPVSGTLDATQRQLYDIVVRAEREAIAACVPGRRYREVHDLAALSICRGLVDAEFLTGDPADLCDRRAHTLFFTHGVGHLLGLDVHDMEDLGDLAGYAPGRTRRPVFGDKYLRLDRDLSPGMVVTIEPGIYFVPEIWANDELVRPFADAINRRAVDAMLERRFGGIRIEDDVHIRAEGDGGPEVLTAALPTDAEAVSSLVGAR